MTAPDPGDRADADVLWDRALEFGEFFPGGANRVIALDDPDVVWFVKEGSLDVFAVENRGAESAPGDKDATLGASELKHVFRAAERDIAFAFVPAETALRLIAKGSADACLLRVPLRAFLREDFLAALAGRVDAWITALCGAVTRDITLLPRIDRRIEAPGEVELPAGTVTASRRGVAWIRVSGDGGGAAYLDTESLSGEGSGLAPLTPEAWVRLGDARSLPSFTTRQLAAGGDLTRALADFHDLIARAELLNRQLLAADVAQAQVGSRRHRLASERIARYGLAELLGRGADRLRQRRMADPDDPQTMLTTALAAIGDWDGIEFRSVPRRQQGGGDVAAPSLDDILRISGVRSRRVTLPPVEDRWWRGDSGALLGFLRQGGEPVALLPGKIGGYRMVSARGVTRINATGARSLLPDAWSFLRSLPDERPATGGDLLRVAGKRLGPDLVRVALFGLGMGTVMLAPAVVFGLLINAIVPAGAVGALLQLTALLAVLGVAGALLRILQGGALLKLEASLALRLDAAIQDRMFKLSPAFMRNFTTGDLAMRASSFRTLRDRVSGLVLHSLLSAVFLLPTFGLLFVYDAVVGWISLILGAVFLALGAVLGFKQLEPQRRWYAASRQLASVLRQFFGSMSKLRTTGAQASAYAIWAQRYREQQRAFLDIGAFDHHLVALSAAMPAFAGAVLLWTASSRFDGATGDFLAVYAASMVFYMAVAQLGHSFAALAGSWPSVDQVWPLLEQRPDTHLVGAGVSGGAKARGSFRQGATPAPPEMGLGTSAGGEVEVKGGLGLHNLSWGYDDGPLILKDVSLYADPGEFIAIVGGSGAGKSTLIRLALGLARPASGWVSYDGRDMERLNASSIRRQIGVVMQEGDLQGGTVLETILGVSSSLTLEDAWRAARFAAVSDEIAAMPMGMNTVIGANGGAMSGGQVQRMQIAAALARNPRILILDEATNWLDNHKQAEVMKNMERLDITRIVVAHRLSTIRRADRIYVLEHGRVAQQGTFDGLSAVEGAFRELVGRQLA